MKVFIYCIALLIAASIVFAQSVVKPTGNAPRFPKAYKDLQKQTKPPSGNWLLV